MHRLTGSELEIKLKMYMQCKMGLIGQSPDVVGRSGLVKLKAGKWQMGFWMGSKDAVKMRDRPANENFYIGSLVIYGCHWARVKKVKMVALIMQSRASLG